MTSLLLAPNTPNYHKSRVPINAPERYSASEENTAPIRHPNCLPGSLQIHSKFGAKSAETATSSDPFKMNLFLPSASPKKATKQSCYNNTRIDINDTSVNSLKQPGFIRDNAVSAASDAVSLPSLRLSVSDKWLDFAQDTVLAQPIPLQYDDEPWWTELDTSDRADSNHSCEDYHSVYDHNEYDEDASADGSVDEDLEFEQKCIEGAKIILKDCIERSPKLNRYNLVSLLGFGTFGVVAKALYNDRHVAVKIMKKCQIHPNRILGFEDGEEELLEINLLKQVQHPNVIGYIDSWFDEEYWYLVTECGGHSWNHEAIDPFTRLPTSLTPLMSPTSRRPPAKLIVELQNPMIQLILKSNSTALSGMVKKHHIAFPDRGNDQSLAGLIRVCGGFSKQIGGRRGPVLPETIQKYIMKQLVDAVYNAHKMGIVHKDLKDENVLVDSDLNIRLIDFGHASYYRCDQYPDAQLFKTYGTPLFAPPEVRSGMPFVGPEADVYALGLMLYEMNHGDLPEALDQARYVQQYPNSYTSGETQLFNITKENGFASNEVIDLVRRMLCFDPQRRIGIDEIRTHTWFKDD